MDRTLQIARRRERRGRLWRLGLLGGVILALALAAGYQFWLRDSSLVEVRNLTIRGVDQKDPEQKPVAEAVRLAVGQMTTLDPRPDLLAEELARFPRVASSDIETSLPDSATVTVRLRRDGSRIGSGAAERLIATDGTVLGPGGERAAQLPEIRSSRVPPAEGRLEGDELAQALVLGGAPDKLRPYVRYSRTGPDGVEVTLSNGLVLGFGNPGQIDHKWRAAAAVIADPELVNAVYVDLSVPRRPAVRGAEDETVDPEADESTTVETAPAG
ncbi:MAG: cell division protein FtsQ/DivIB [Solirubrobacterales bacterium]|nr:cell division protein FtsQ/DivIB [Solirubrobacterales bacterium]